MVYAKICKNCRNCVTLVHQNQSKQILGFLMEQIRHVAIYA